MVTSNGRGGITTALIYTRISTDEQRDGVSLDTQLRECRRYVAGQGWIIGHEYQDVLSGTRDDRPDYVALLDEARRLRADDRDRLAVVVMRLDRFGRRVLERVRCREELKALGVPTHSVREGGEVSDLVANILASVAEEEIRVLGERVSAARRHVAALGWFPVGMAAWGYRWRDSTAEERASGSPKRVLEVDLATASFVREAFERVAAGESMRSVARWVRDLPSSARGGKTMHQNAVIRALRSPVYVARQRRTDDSNPLTEPAGRWPKLVSEVIWAEVQRRTNGHRKMPRQASGRYLLTGLTRCPACGQRMQVGIMAQRLPRYRCSDVRGRCKTMVVMAPVDAYVLNQVGQALRSLASVDREFRASLHQAWELLRRPPGEDTTARRTALEQAFERARQRIVRGTEMLLDGDLDRPSYDAICARARADIEASEAELARLPSEQPAVGLPDLQVVLREMHHWAAVLAESDVPRQREVLFHLIEQVVPHHGTVRGHYEVEIVWTTLGLALRSALGSIKEEAA